MTSNTSPHARLLRTATFAAEKHKDQRRKDANKTPYILHPLNVADHLINAGEDDLATLQAALLHDTVEDTKTTVEEIRQHFGDRVAKIVEEVTDDKSLAKADRKRRQIEKARTASRPAKLIKLADKLHNLTDLVDNPPPSWDWKRIQGYFVWCYFVVDAIRGTNQALERKLSSLFEGEFRLKDGVAHPCLPKDVPLEQALEEYYATCE